MSNGSILEFRRRHSSLDSNSNMTSSIILRPSIFRNNFRPSLIHVRDYPRASSKKKIIIRKRKKNFDLK